LAVGAFGAGQPQITIRGQVIDDSLNRPLSGAYVFVSGTRYGAITDAEGNFNMSFPSDWEPVRSGQIKLEVPRIPFAMKGTMVQVELAGSPGPAPLTIRLRSIPERGTIRGRAIGIQPPIPLSELGKNKH
jgi:hypothetical protein